MKTISLLSLVTNFVFTLSLTLAHAETVTQGYNTFYLPIYDQNATQNSLNLADLGRVNGANARIAVLMFLSDPAKQCTFENISTVKSGVFNPLTNSAILNELEYFMDDGNTIDVSFGGPGSATEKNTAIGPLVKGCTPSQIVRIIENINKKLNIELKNVDFNVEEPEFISTAINTPENQQKSVKYWKDLGGIVTALKSKFPNMEVSLTIPGYTGYWEPGYKDAESFVKNYGKYISKYYIMSMHWGENNFENKFVGSLTQTASKLNINPKNIYLVYSTNEPNFTKAVATATITDHVNQIKSKLTTFGGASVWPDTGGDSRNIGNEIASKINPYYIRATMWLNPIWVDKDKTVTKFTLATGEEVTAVGDMLAYTTDKFNDYTHCENFDLSCIVLQNNIRDELVRNAKTLKYFICDDDCKLIIKNLNYAVREMNALHDQYFEERDAWDGLYKPVTQSVFFQHVTSSDWSEFAVIYLYCKPILHGITLNEALGSSNYYNENKANRSMNMHSYVKTNTNDGKNEDYKSEFEIGCTGYRMKN